MYPLINDKMSANRIFDIQSRIFVTQALAVFQKILYEILYKGVYLFNKYSLLHHSKTTYLSGILLYNHQGFLFFSMFRSYIFFLVLLFLISYYASNP